MTHFRTAQSEGFIGCQRCASVWPSDRRYCNTCGARLVRPSRTSLIWVLFWLVLGIAAYVPANLYPMLETRILFRSSEDTIVAGALKLIEHGSWGVAAIVLLASVVIPVAKFIAIAWLVMVVQFRMRAGPKSRNRIFHAVELIGRWSMVDVFVVAILVSLVQIPVLANVKAGPAAAAFALSVIFTMFSALSFDSRLIWDNKTSATNAVNPTKQ